MVHLNGSVLTAETSTQGQQRWVPLIRRAV